MSLSHLILLSIIQGITEFLPISSSGHLILVPNLINLPDQGRVLDVSVHFGSFCAVILYLWREIFKMIIGITTIGNRSKKDLWLAIYIVLGSMPMIFVGYFIQNAELNWLRSIEIVAWSTLVFGIFLFVSDKFFLRVKRIEDLRLFSVLIIGLFQIFAFLPGTSRSGITITAARLLGFERKEAAKFSLFLSIPAILGASFLEAVDLYYLNDTILSWNVFFVALLSFFISLSSIYIMMSWLTHSTFTPFVVYRLILGVILLMAIYLW